MTTKNQSIWNNAKQGVIVATYVAVLGIGIKAYEKLISIEVMVARMTEQTIKHHEELATIKQSISISLKEQKRKDEEQDRMINILASQMGILPAVLIFLTAVNAA